MIQQINIDGTWYYTYDDVLYTDKGIVIKFPNRRAVYEMRACIQPKWWDMEKGDLINQDTRKLGKHSGGSEPRDTSTIAEITSNSADSPMKDVTIDPSSFTPM